jgi:predicted nucleic acid-binding protein
MILLDTNVVSEPMRPQPDPQVVAWLDSQAVETLYLSTISLSELLLGIQSLPTGKRRRALGAALSEQIAGLFGSRIISFDIEATEAYAPIVARARRRGHTISVSDGQIAAIATSRSLSVATRDVAPFQMAGLAVINPWQIGP